jgi:hypothetical protein
MTEPRVFCGDKDGCCPCHDWRDCCHDIEAHCCYVLPCGLCGLLVVPMVDERPCKGRMCLSELVEIAVLSAA